MDNKEKNHVHLVQGETIKNKPSWKKWSNIMLLLCLIVEGWIFLQNSRYSKKGGSSMFHIQDEVLGGNGFESLLAYDIEEIDNGNPWQKDMALFSLPVFENRAYHPAGEPVGLDENAIMGRLEATCLALGLDRTEIAYEYNELGVISIKASTNGVVVTAKANGMIEINFENGLVLPNFLHFTLYHTSQSEAKEAMTYFIQKFAKLIDFENPQIVLSGDYLMDYQNGNAVRFKRSYMLYESSEDEIENLLNYQMNFFQFYPDEVGRLSMIRIYDHLSCVDKLGDYPIITLSKARKQLLEGKYVTSVPYEIKDESLIQKEELVYRWSALEKTIMPYYRFYVKLPDISKKEGLTCFGAYYVPAIKAEHIPISH